MTFSGENRLKEKDKLFKMQEKRLENKWINKYTFDQKRDVFNIASKTLPKYLGN